MKNVPIPLPPQQQQQQESSRNYCLLLTQLWKGRKSKLWTNAVEHLAATESGTSHRCSVTPNVQTSLLWQVTSCHRYLKVKAVNLISLCILTFGQHVCSMQVTENLTISKHQCPETCFSAFMCGYNAAENWTYHSKIDTNAQIYVYLSGAITLKKLY